MLIFIFFYNVRLKVTTESFFNNSKCLYENNSKINKTFSYDLRFVHTRLKSKHNYKLPNKMHKHYYCFVV